MAVTNINLENFDQQVTNAASPVLVDFWAAWCGPCSMLSPVVEELAQEHPEIAFGKVNVDEAPELAQKLYDLKQAGEQHYNDYVALLDEQVSMAGAGIFKEYGSGRTASDLDSTVAQMQKAAPSLTRAQAVVKAFEMNPALDPFTGRVK